MKKTLKHLFSAAISAIMLFACVFPNFAAADTELSSVDAEKLEAFLPGRQVTEGITSIIRIMRTVSFFQPKGKCSFRTESA